MQKKYRDMKNLMNKISKNLILPLALTGSLVLGGCKNPEIFKVEKKDYIEFNSFRTSYIDLGKDGALDIVYEFKDDAPLKIIKISYTEQSIITSDKDGNILFSIKDNLTKFNEQVKFMQKNFDDLKEEYKKQQ